MSVVSTGSGRSAVVSGNASFTGRALSEAVGAISSSTAADANGYQSLHASSSGTRPAGGAGTRNPAKCQGSRGESCSVADQPAANTQRKANSFGFGHIPRRVPTPIDERINSPNTHFGVRNSWLTAHLLRNFSLDSTHKSPHSGFAPPASRAWNWHIPKRLLNSRDYNHSAVFQSVPTSTKNQ